MIWMQRFEMGITLNEFQDDVARLLLSLDLLHNVGELPTYPIPEGIEGSEFVKSATELHEFVRANKASILMWPPAIILYVCGRFEYYVKSAVETAAQEIATASTSYNRLPEDMRNNYYRLSIEAINYPRRYGYNAEETARMIKSLSDNLSEDSIDLDYERITITASNMRSDVVNELFKRIGFGDYWKIVGDNLDCRRHYQTYDNKVVISSVKKELEDMMDLRNSIAHPASGTTLPNLDATRKAILFFRMLSIVTEEICQHAVLKHSADLARSSGGGAAT
jgi:RiboL-PSP-HEPN